MFLHQRADADSTRGASSEGSALSMQPTAREAAGALRGRRAGLGAVDIHRRVTSTPVPRTSASTTIAHAYRCVYDDGAKCAHGLDAQVAGDGGGGSHGKESLVSAVHEHGRGRIRGRVARFPAVRTPRRARIGFPSRSERTVRPSRRGPPSRTDCIQRGRSCTKRSQRIWSSQGPPVISSMLKVTSPSAPRRACGRSRAPIPCSSA